MDERYSGVKTQDGRLIILAGASRSGKTAWAAKHYGKASRALAWDPEDQWAKLRGWTRHTAAHTFAAAALQPGPGRHAYVPGPLVPMPAAFDFVCQCMFTAVDRHGATVCIGEELADVTNPAKAPTHWGLLLRRGLKRGATILAISQRWAEADKTALGNASQFVIFRQSSADDVKYISRKTRVPAAEIDALKPLEFVTYDAGTQTHATGRLRF